MMKSIFHKWVLNAMTASNPTQYTDSDKIKDKVKMQKSRLVRNWSEVRIFRILCPSEPEISNLQIHGAAVFRGEQDVLRLQVPMHNFLCVQVPRM